jgi:hypothetical protein
MSSNNNPVEQNNGQNAATTSSNQIEIAENELNSSIGSNRSLNSRIFPFRISRDIILNNVSSMSFFIINRIPYSLSHRTQKRKKKKTLIICSHYFSFVLFFKVFQEIRPLVQNNSNTNNAGPFASWMRSSLQSVNNTNEEHSDNNNRPQEINDTSSVIINIASPSTSYARQNSAPARTTTDSTETMGSVSASQSRISLNHQTQSSDDSAANSNNNDETNAADLNPDNLSQIPEARALIRTISRYFPYVCILFAKTCYDHLDGILDIFALFVVFAHSNFTLKQEITKQAQRRFLYLIRELIYIILVITIIGFLLEKKDNSISLFFAPLNIPPEEKQLALKDLLFSVCITDLILKLLTVAIKILFTMLPRKAVEFKNRVSLITSCVISNE